MAELDPRWEWTSIQRLCDPEPRYIKAYFRHIDAVPVDSGDETVAYLCLTCDSQLPPEWLGP